jgi:hypothetical protein
MNVGGTTGPSWDGEMTPRLKLTAVPYAFTAGKLVGGTGANTTTLDFGINGLFNTVSSGATVDTTNRVSPAFTCYALAAAANQCYWDYYQVRGTASADR